MLIYEIFYPYTIMNETIQELKKEIKSEIENK